MGSVENILYDQEIHSLFIPENIRQSGKATNELVAEGVAFLHRDGMVVLENAVDTAHIDTLNNLLSKEALELAADPSHHFNFGKETQNMDQAPPPQKDLMFKDIWCNPFAAAILAGILGLGICKRQYGSQGYWPSARSLGQRVRTPKFSLRHGCQYQLGGYEC